MCIVLSLKNNLWFSKGFLSDYGLLWIGDENNKGEQNSVSGTDSESPHGSLSIIYRENISDSTK